MARTARASKGGICYHVINRGNARATVYHDDSDYHSFAGLLKKASDRIPLRILAFCLMPNHFHLVLWPYVDGDLSRWMHWLLTSHVRRYHKIRSTSGRVWQGRFKAFPIQEDRHLLTVMRYVGEIGDILLFESLTQKVECPQPNFAANIVAWQEQREHQRAASSTTP